MSQNNDSNRALVKHLLFGFAVTQSLVLTYLTPNLYSISPLLHLHFHLLFLRLILFLYSFPSPPASSIPPSCFLQHENKGLMLFSIPVEAYQFISNKGGHTRLWGCIAALWLVCLGWAMLWSGYFCKTLSCLVAGLYHSQSVFHTSGTQIT